MTERIPGWYGQPEGPRRPRDELLAEFLEGASQGVAEDMRIEGDLLVGHDTGLAIRLPTGLLVRSDSPEEAADLCHELEQRLADAGMARVDEQTVLGMVVGIEVAGLRGSEWDLWAADADSGREALAHRALGEMADRIDPDEPARREQTEASLREIERGLWPEEGPEPEEGPDPGP